MQVKFKISMDYSDAENPIMGLEMKAVEIS
jgi:hypothetical protein